MDIHVFKSSTNWFLSDRFFLVWIYSGRFFSGPGLFELVSFGSDFLVKRILDLKGICKFSVWFRVGIFRSVPVRVFRSKLKCPRLLIVISFPFYLLWLNMKKGNHFKSNVLQEFHHFSTNYNKKLLFSTSKVCLVEGDNRRHIFW